MQYITTQSVSLNNRSVLEKLHVGQWIHNINGSPNKSHGQFMGFNQDGAPMIRWQRVGTRFGAGNPTDKRADARANKAVRDLVKLYECVKVSTVPAVNNQSAPVGPITSLKKAIQQGNFGKFKITGGNSGWVGAKILVTEDGAYCLKISPSGYPSSHYVTSKELCWDVKTYGNLKIQKL